MDEQFIRDRITQLRLEKHVSEYKMSYDLGQSRSYIQSISSGRALPSLPMLLDICDYFGITPEEFFHEEHAEVSPVLIKDFLTDFCSLGEEDRTLICTLTRRLNQKAEVRKTPAEQLLSHFSEPQT